MLLKVRQGLAIPKRSKRSYLPEATPSILTDLATGPRIRKPLLYPAELRDHLSYFRHLGGLRGGRSASPQLHSDSAVDDAGPATRTFKTAFGSSQAEFTAAPMPELRPPRHLRDMTSMPGHGMPPAGHQPAGRSGLRRDSLLSASMRLEATSSTDLKGRSSCMSADCVSMRL